MLISNSGRRHGGFTLVELLVAIAALGFVLIFSLGSFTTSRNTYTVIDNVSEAHQNSLAIASLVERDLRAAGFMVFDALAACGLDSTNSPDMLFVSDADAIRNPEDLPSTIAADDLGARVTNGMTTWTPPTVTITVDDLVIDGQATYDTDLTPGADSDFQVGAGVIVSNLDDPSRGVGCGVVTGINTGTNQITLLVPSTPAGETSAMTDGNPGDDWRAVPAHAYVIAAGNQLQRNQIALL